MVTVGQQWPRHAGQGLPGSQTVAEAPKIGFYLVLLALLFEFGRPQDFFPPLKVIPFPTLIDVAIAGSVLIWGKASLANMQGKLWLGLLGVMACWVPFANNNFYAFMVFKDMTLYFFLFLGIVAFVNTTERMQTVMVVWLAVHSVLAVNGLLHSGRGIGGWLGDENDFGMEMNVAVPFAFFLFQGAKTAKEKIPYLIVLGVLVLSSMSTFSRGGFIGLMVVGTFCWFYSPAKIRSFVLVLCVALVVAMTAPDEYWERIATITDDKTTEVGTAGQRMFTWGIGWEMFLANPIVGIGQGNFPWTIGEYLAGRTWQTKSLAGRQAHSLYFTLLPELGLVGFCVFFSMIYLNYRDVRTSYWLSFRKRIGLGPNAVAERLTLDKITWFGNAMLGALIGYLITSTFISTLYYPTFWIMSGLIVALKNTTINLVEHQATPAPASQPRQPVQLSQRFRRRAP